MKMHKLDKYGYKYIVMDAGWQSDALAQDGFLIADEIKFPNGIELLTKYVNGQGFELGIYSSPNKKTCGALPGTACSAIFRLGSEIFKI